MWKTTFAVPMLCLTLLMLIGCSGETQEDIALEVAEKWTDVSIDNVSDSVVQVLVGEFPIISRLAGGILATQVKERVSWNYRGVGSEGDDIYRVVATASVNLSFSLPVVGDREYAISLPFDLWIDTEERSVNRWVPNISSASVSEKES